MQEVDLFEYVASVVDLLADPYRPVTLIAPADGSVWMLYPGEEGTVTLARWERDRQPVVLSFSEGEQVALDEAGRAWRISREVPEVELWAHGSWKAYLPGQEWDEDEMPTGGWRSSGSSRLLRDTQGRYWWPLEREVLVLEGGCRTDFTLEDMGFPVPEWEDITIAHRIAVLQEQGQIWVGACYSSGPGPMGGAGVRYFDGSAWQGAGAPIGPACVSAMEVDRAGDLWLGVENAVWRYQPGGGEWSAYPLPEALLSGQNFGQPRDLLIDRVGGVYAIMQMCGGASCDGPANLYRLQDGEWSLLAQAGWWLEPLKELVQGTDGKDWLFWEGGFYQLEGGSLNRLAVIEPRGVAGDAAGRVWALVGHGEQAALWVLDGEQLK